MEAEPMVGLLRRMRHDFANHLQVLSGYVDLGWQERLSTYIHSLIEDLNAERIIFESLEAAAALYFYEQLLKIKDLGIILTYEDLDIQSLEILKNKNEPFSTVAAMQSELVAVDDEPVLYLSVYEDEKAMELWFSSENWEENPRKISLIKE